MTQIAVFGNNIPLLTYVPAGMTPETTIRFPMSDMIEITAAGRFHPWKIILMKFLLNTHDCFFYQVPMTYKNFRVFILIIRSDVVSDFQKGRIGGGKLIAQNLHGGFFDEW